MRKRGLPGIVRVLCLHDSAWVVGGACEYVSGNPAEDPKDYDIVFTNLDEYGNMVSVLRNTVPEGALSLNTFGGIKVVLGDTVLDIWYDQLARLMKRPLCLRLYHPMSDTHWKAT